MLELESLQLDVHALQRYREDDQTEFLEFTKTVNKNFLSIQNNFDSIQINFELLFAIKTSDTPENGEPDAIDRSPGGQASNFHNSPTNQVGQSANSVKQMVMDANRGILL